MTPPRSAVECAGLFGVTLAVGTGVRTGSPLAPIVVGATLMVMIYVGSRMTGAHYHPAVTIAAIISGRLPLDLGVRFIVAQLAGAITGAATATAVVPRAHTPTPSSAAQVLVVIAAEVLFTYALCRTVLNGARPPDSLQRLRTATLVTLGAVAVGDLSGGAINPAVVAGGALSGLFSDASPAVYLAAQLVTAALIGAALRSRARVAELPGIPQSETTGGGYPCATTHRGEDHASRRRSRRQSDTGGGGLHPQRDQRDIRRDRQRDRGRRVRCHRGSQGPQRNRLGTARAVLLDPHPHRRHRHPVEEVLNSASADSL
jgi:aquaporin Z